MSEVIPAAPLESDRSPAGWSFPALWALAFGATSITVLYTAMGLWLYAYRPGIMPFPPLFWLGIVVSGGMVLLLFRRNWQMLWSTPVFYWCILFLGCVLFSFLVAGLQVSAVAESLSAVLTVSLLCATILLAADPRVYQILVNLMIAALVLAFAMNVIDFIAPLTFSVSLGRSSGFYVNPNISGYTLGAGMLVTLHAVRERWRPWFIIMCGVGVFLTLSRGAMLNWMVCTGFLAWRSVVSVRRLAIVGGLFFATGVTAMAVSGRLQTLIESFDLTDRKVWERLDFSEEAAITDRSLSSRRHLARRAWETFAANPVIGAGLGATRSLEEAEDTHNMYLKYLAQLGILGPLLFLAYAVSVGWNGRGELRVFGQAAMIFLALHGLFSHNVLDDRPSLIFSGMMAVLMARSRMDARGSELP